MIKAADYTTGKQPTLTLYIISDGQRHFGETISVSGKREARLLAKARGYTPWNF